jgi:hypothetical protein
MNRKKISWFGFNLTQKQSVHIFILSIAGLIISVFLLMTLVFPIIMINIYYDNYYPDDSYIIMTIISMLPFMFLSGVVFLLSLYSLIQCRKIAKYYSPLVDPVLEPKTKSQYNEVTPDPIAKFCPNCGKIKKSHEKFCTNCGQ